MANTKWTVDAVHSEINFSVKHMMISRVNGTFHSWNAEIEADPKDLTNAQVDVTVDLASIDTRNKDRDGHLKSEDFFDVANHPTMTFKATDFKRTNENQYDVTGDLTIRGVTLPVTFKAVVEGVSKDPMSGVEKSGFTAEGKIKRSDFGLQWNVALETGGVLVGDEVSITIALELEKAE